MGISHPVNAPQTRTSSRSQACTPNLIAVWCAMPRKKPAIPLVAVVIIPRVLNIPNGAKYLSATTWFVEKLLSAGEVPSFIQGRERVVDVRELDKYVDRRNAEAPVKLVSRVENIRKAA